MIARNGRERKRKKVEGVGVGLSSAVKNARQSFGKRGGEKERGLSKGMDDEMNHQLNATQNWHNPDQNSIELQ